MLGRCEREIRFDIQTKQRPARYPDESACGNHEKFSRTKTVGRGEGI
jgi:hypothetical protein